MEIMNEEKKYIKIDNNSLSAFVGLYMSQLGTTSNTNVYVNKDTSLTSITDGYQKTEDGEKDCIIVNDFNTDASIDVFYNRGAINADPADEIRLGTISDAAYPGNWPHVASEFSRMMIKNDLYIRDYYEEEEVGRIPREEFIPENMR